MSSPFRVDAFDDKIPRSGFDSGSEALDRYFKLQITQDIRRRIASAFVAVESASGVVAGFYTLAASSVPLSGLPEEMSRKMPRYPAIPAVRLGRLAVGRQLHGRGLGGALLADALIRYVRSDIAAYAMVVDAKDAVAADFYRHHGFIELKDAPAMLFIPINAKWARR